MLVTTFHAGGLFCGIPVADVQEILRPQEMTPVPLAPPAVAGLINLRGQIVTALDLRERLALPVGPVRQSMNIVVRGRQGAVSLLVDRIGDVVDLPAQDLQPAPGTLAAPLQGLVRGLHPLEDGLLLLLDLPAVLGSEEPEGAPS